MKKSIKIPVHHYIEITKQTNTVALSLASEYYITNEGGKKYLVEVWQ